MARKLIFARDSAMCDSADALRSAWLASCTRGRLHDADAWADDGAADRCVSLTYVATGAGFAGRAELARFARLFPGPHPFAGRGGAEVRSVCVSVAVDACGGATVTEEAVLSMQHARAAEWLAPGVPATGRALVLPLVIVASLDARAVTTFAAQHAARLLAGSRPAAPFAPEVAAPGATPFPALRRASVYWDGAAVLAQLGVVRMAFEPLVSAHNAAAFEACAARLPIADAARVAHRLVHGAAPANGNVLCPLDALEAARTVHPGAPVRLAPIGGLDSVGALARELAREHCPSPSRRAVFSAASVFDEQRPAAAHVPARETPVFSSRNVLSVLSDNAPAPPEAPSADGRAVMEHDPFGRGRSHSLALSAESSSERDPFGRGRTHYAADAPSAERTALGVAPDPMRNAESAASYDIAPVGSSADLYARRSDVSHLVSSLGSNGDGSVTGSNAKRSDVSHLVSSFGSANDGSVAGSNAKRSDVSHLASSFQSDGALEGTFSAGPHGRKVDASHLRSTLNAHDQAIPDGTFATGGHHARRVETSHLKSTFSERDDQAIPEGSFATGGHHARRVNASHLVSSLPFGDASAGPRRDSAAR